MDHLVTTHVVQVCSNLQLSLKECSLPKVHVAMKEIVLCIFYATAIALCRAGTVYFFTKRSRFSELHPVRRRI